MNMSGLIDTEQNEWKKKLMSYHRVNIICLHHFPFVFHLKITYIDTHTHTHTHTHYYKFWCELILEVLYLPRLLEFIGIPNHAC